MMAGPIKKYIEEDMKVNTDREQVYFENWDEAALRRIIDQQRKITQTSKELKMKRLYQILITIDDFADSPHLHKKTGDAALEHPVYQRPSFPDFHVGQHPEAALDQQRRAGQRPAVEKDSLLEKLTAFVPKQQLHAMYEEAVREPYSFLYIYLLNPRNELLLRCPAGPGAADLGALLGLVLLARCLLLGCPAACCLLLRCKVLSSTTAAPRPSSTQAPGSSISQQGTQQQAASSTRPSRAVR